MSLFLWCSFSNFINGSIVFIKINKKKKKDILNTLKHKVFVSGKK